MTNAIAYAALLWDEFPRCRQLLLDYLLHRNSRTRRRARAERGVPQLSFYEKLRVVSAGLLLYSKLPRRRRPAAPFAIHAEETSAAQK